VERVRGELQVAAYVLVAVEEDEGARLVLVEDALILASNLAQVLLPLGLEEL